MKTNYISRLIDVFFKARYHADTESKVQEWLLENKNQAEKEDALIEVWNSIDAKPNAEVYNSLNSVKKQLGMKVSNNFWHNSAYRVAAVLVPFVIASSVLFFLNRDVKMIEIATLTGEQKEVILPDGSVVWMNSCSKITYPERFKGNSREICLTGEALFSVTRNESKEFTVITENLKVNVLGTKFNVKAYAGDDNVTATLLQGKVEVVLENKDYMLKPNQELVYNNECKSSIIRDIPGNSDSWRNGQLVFSDITFKEILRNLERQYGVSFKYVSTYNSSDNYSLKFTNTDDIEYIMEVLQDVVGDFSYNIKHDSIIIDNI